MKAEVDINKIKTILITHEHMDHIDGITGVLALLIYQTSTPKVEIYSSTDVIDLIKNRLSTCKPELDKNRYNLIDITEPDQISAGGFEISPFKTNHTSTSLGFILKYENNKVICTGDLQVDSDNEKETMIHNFKGASIAIVDAVHISVNVASCIARDASVGKVILITY